jgi:dihydroxyacid dehydratase/phosphogluconate dehydratase
MSGTAYGTVILHVCPEAAAGGPLAVVREGDLISLDVEARSLVLEISEDELLQRLSSWTPPAELPPSGFQRLYVQHVNQASTGADFDFLLGYRGTKVTRESH